MTEVLAYQTKATVKEKLFNLIQTKGYKQGAVTLSSGEQSNFYFDLRPLTLSPESATLIADMMIEQLPDIPITVGGLEAGAIPIAAAICTRYTGPNDVKGFFVRKQAKGHGKKQLIEGNFNPEIQSVIVEDVASTGGSILKAAEAIRAQGGTVNTAIVIVDRQENAHETLKKAGITLISLFGQSDFMGENKA
jgi:orotate phosphoribosyltransferase